jgi:hypothetical protein
MGSAAFSSRSATAFGGLSDQVIRLTLRNFLADLEKQSRQLARFSLGIYAACCSALPFACSFTSILPRVALE